MLSLHSCKECNMEVKPVNKKLIVVSVIIIASIVILILITQLVLGSIITSRVHDAISNNKNQNYTIDIKKAKVNLFTMSLIFKGVKIEPDSNMLLSLKEGKVTEPLYRVNAPTLRIRNIGVFSFLMSKEVDVGSIVLKNARIDVLVSGNKNKVKAKDNVTPKNFNSDSIPIKGISGGSINYLSFSSMNIVVLNYKTGDTVFSAPELDIELDKINILKNQDSTFKLKLDELKFELQNEKFYLPGNRYFLSFDKLTLDKKKKKLDITDLIIKPRYSRDKMVSFSEYQYEIYDLEIEKVEVNSLLIARAARDSGVYISDVNIEGMKIDIYKDKSKPFDEEKRPKLPNQLLRKLDMDLFIGNINIINSELVYSEKHDLVKELMSVDLANLTVNIENVTSITDSIIAGAAMKIKLRANIQKTIPMGVDLYFPMKSVSDTFYFSGYMNKGNLKSFNNILLPALGITFENGVLDKLEFRASANPSYSLGEMTMQYHDIEGNVRRQDMINQNKFLSWAANQIIISNNPISNKPVRTVPMYFERVPYKGLGNFLWKTLQSGIMATVIPTVSGRLQGEIDSKLGITKEDRRKHEREMRKAEKAMNKKSSKSN